MNRRQTTSKNPSNESLNIHSTGAGIRKSNSRSRRRAVSPHWSEEAVRGSATPGIPISNNATTLTQENFNAWMDAQRAYEHSLGSALPHTPEDAAAVDEWLGIMPTDDASVAMTSGPQPWSTYPLSTDISPVTAPDHTYSPSPAAFTGMPAIMPLPAEYSPLLFSSTNPSVTSFNPTGTINDFAFNPNPPFQQDLLGVGSFASQIPMTQSGQRPRYDLVPRPAIAIVLNADHYAHRRPLRYKPLSTWFHLWLT